MEITLLGDPFKRNVPGHRQRFQIDGGNGLALLVGDESIAGNRPPGASASGCEGNGEEGAAGDHVSRVSARPRTEFPVQAYSVENKT